MEPLRHDPETYLATADVAYIRPILVAALADAENLPVDLAEKYIDLHLTQWQPPDWVAPHLATLKVDLRAKVKMALALLRSMLSADTMARRHGLPVRTVRALMCAQRLFIRDRR